MFLPVKNGNLNATLSDFFQSLITSGMVGEVLVPLEIEGGKSVVPGLVKDPGLLRAVRPFVPLALVNSARLVSDLTFSDPGQRIGVVVRPCELRALVELAKLKQVNLEHLLLIGVDCVGTLHPVDYRRMIETGINVPENWVRETAPGDVPEGWELRPACGMCESIGSTVGRTGLHLGWLGMDVTTAIWVEGGEDILARWAGQPGLEAGEMPVTREDALNRLEETRREDERRILAEFDERYAETNALLDLFATCLNCQNCRRACPLCFCRQCVFESDLFTNRESEEYVSWAARKGAIELPANKLLFHLTRASHMGLSCVGCGQCESACPVKLPLTSLFKAAGRRLQDIFQYLPGRDPAEPLPVTIYREVELEPQ
jgi:formate dehydrogenase subunit beta